MTQPGWNQSYSGQQGGYMGAQYPPQYGNEQSRGYPQNQQQYIYTQNQPGSGNNANDYPRNEQPSSEPNKLKKHSTSVVLTAAMLASLIGAGVGAGVGGGIAASNSGGSGSVSSTVSKGSGTINSNNLNSTDPTVITETAKKVLPSTVTVGVKIGTGAGTGSGEILDASGHILTNNHVVANDSTKADQVEVRLHDGTVRTAKIVGTDPSSDLSVIKIDPKGLDLTPITFGDSSKLVPGDQVVALGSPYDHRDSVTVGVVASSSRVRPADDKKTYIPMIQSDAEINHGNSGGPLVNTRGELIGINTQGYRSDDGGAAAGMSFSVTSNYAKRISDEIIAKGKASHGYLGASVKTTGATTDNGKSVLFEGGVELTDVSHGSPADKAGLMKGDVVVEVDGHRIEADEELNGTIRSMAPNTKTTFKVRRGSDTKDIQVTLGDSDSK